MIEVRKLRKSFGKREILHGLDLTFDKGVYGLLGPNGAGKTTLMSIMVGLLQPTAGDVLFQNRSILGKNAFYLKKLGFLPQYPGYYKNYTAFEFMEYMSALKGIKGDNREQIDNLLSFVNLEDAADQKLETFSGGMLRRVGLAQTLLGEPEVIILDEPTAGLDPIERIRLRNLLSEISRERTVIVATHIVPDIEYIANEVILLFDGSVVDARAVILATGVAHKGLGLPGEADLIGCGLSFCAVCDGPFCAGQDAAVIGGGDTALQDAIFLSGICRSVTLIHRRDSFRAEKRLVEKASSQGNIHFLYDTVTEEYLTEDGSVSGLRLRNVKTGESFTKPFDGIFLAVGQKPQNDFLHGAAAVDPEGYLYSDETALTGTAGIFAAGDCRTKDVRQLTTAVGDGACAAIAACRYLDR